MSILFLGVASLTAGTAGAQTGNIAIGGSTAGSRLTLGGSFAAAFRTATASTTLNADDHFLLYSGAAAGTVTLPASQAGAGNFAGRVYKIRNGSSQPLIIAASGGERIDGNLSIGIAAGHTAELISSGATTGTTWKIVSAGPSVYSLDALRGALTAGGCASCAVYDAAANGTWVNITAAEYAAMQSLSGSGSYGVSSGNMAPAPTNGWTGGYTVTQQFANSTQLPASNYVYALAVKTSGTPPSTMAGMKLKLSNTSQTAGYADYPSSSATTPAAGTPVGGTIYYFALKKPAVTSPSGSASNMAIYTPVTGQLGNGTMSGTSYYGSSDVANPSSGFSNALTLFQVLATPTLQW